MLGKGELFGEAEIVRSEYRKTSAVCTSLDGGELMIINRSDLESRVLYEEEHRKRFEAYVDLKQRQMEMTLLGVTSSLTKYKNFRFTTVAQRNQQEDLCE